MLILNCNILLLLSYYFESSYGFHKYSMMYSSSSEQLENIDNIGRQGLLKEFAQGTVQYLRTPMDHFNYDGQLWNMPYFSYDKYHKANGPIILQIGGEGMNFAIFSDFSVQLARETGGALFTNQHRYYGSTSNEFPSLEYLSSKQSLADIAYLLGYLKVNPRFKMSKVVVIGCSYAGSLAVWMRLLYPNLVDAAHASSAPLVIKPEFPEFMQHCSDVFKQHCDPNDYEDIKKRFEHYDTLLKTRDLQQFASETGVCTINDLRDVHAAFDQLSLRICGGMQGMQQHLIKKHCKNINDEDKFWEAGVYPKPCGIVSFYDRVQNVKGATDSLRYWNYQLCTEFGFFLTLTSKDQIFTQNLPVEYFYAFCRAVFGPEFTVERINRGVEETNRLYGGLNRNITRVVFVNGELDPWSRLSVLEDLSPEAPAIVIPKGSHCMDTLHPSWGTNPDLIEAQKFSKKMIKKWIGL